MLVNRSNLDALFVNLKTEFTKGMETADSYWAKVAMKIPSTGAFNDYAWLSKFPQMKRWIGSKNIETFKGYDYIVNNEDFEVTVEVSRNQIQDDQLGMVGTMARSAGESAKNLPDEIVAEMINGAFSLKCWDGKPFCANNHKLGGQTINNKGTMPLDVTSAAAAEASYGLARQTMRSMKDEHGRPLAVNPNVLVVGTLLEDKAKYLMTTDKFPNDEANIYKGSAEVVSVPWIESDAAWFLLDTSKVMKPFIYQEREKAKFVEMTRIDNERVFMNATFLYGAEARAAGAYGFYQLCYGSTGEG